MKNNLIPNFSPTFLARSLNESNALLKIELSGYLESGEKDFVFQNQKK